jgi:16S rRNA (cytosine1402-N4)-methyltransferase
MTYVHIPVLLNEVLEYLKPGAGENFVDATLGGGGYTKAILERNRPNGKVLAIDLDNDAIENFKTLTPSLSQRERVQTVQGNFSHIDKIVEHHKFNNISGIVADLGLSSYELEHRGMSFQTDQPLDMRFDKHGNTVDAKFVLNNYDEKRLKKFFEDYGEEKFSKQIASKVVGLRAKGEGLRHTTDLYKLIQDALPKPAKHKADDSARRIFQALRIEVNHELENLEEFLPKAFDLLNTGGRLVVVSFHSLEDRIVKQFFVGLTKGCVCPIDFPQCVCGKNPQGRILTKKLISPSEAELEKNPRSKPAKLRAIIKI